MELVREITECCICADTYTDPIILSCIHTFCLKCLKETAAKRESKPGDTMPCPLCRKHFLIPLEGMAGLQKNFFMNSLLEIAKLSEPPSTDLSCDVCKADAAEDESKEIPPAVKFCIECRQNICDRCCRDHKRFRKLQNHELVDIGNPLKEEIIRKSSLQYCDVHGKQEAYVYCVDCKKVICMMGFVQKHKSHDCSDIDEVGEGFRKQIKCDTEKMSGYVDEATAKIQRTDTMKTNFQQKIEDVEKEIVQRGIELKELVDKCTRSLLEELALRRQQISKETQIWREEIETHKMVIQSFETYCMEMSSKGSSAEVCRAAADLHLRAEELLKTHQKYILREISAVDLDFEKSALETFLDERNIIGSIRESAFVDQLHDDDDHSIQDVTLRYE